MFNGTGFSELSQVCVFLCSIVSQNRRLYTWSTWKLKVAQYIKKWLTAFLIQLWVSSSSSWRSHRYTPIPVLVMNVVILSSSCPQPWSLICSGVGDGHTHCRTSCRRGHLCGICPVVWSSWLHVQVGEVASLNCRYMWEFSLLEPVADVSSSGQLAALWTVGGRRPFLSLASWLSWWRASSHCDWRLCRVGLLVLLVWPACLLCSRKHHSGPDSTGGLLFLLFQPVVEPWSGRGPCCSQGLLGLRPETPQWAGLHWGAALLALPTCCRALVREGSLLFSRASKF